MVERQWLYLPMYLISLKWIHLLSENIVSFRWTWTKESWFDSKSKENDDGWGEKVLATGQTNTFTTKFWNKEWKNAHRKPERKKIESGEEKETEKQWPLVPLLCGWRLIIHIKLCHYAWGDDFFRIFFYSLSSSRSLFTRFPFLVCCFFFFPPAILLRSVLHWMCLCLAYWFRYMH